MQKWVTQVGRERVSDGAMWGWKINANCKNEMNGIDEIEELKRRNDEKCEKGEAHLEVPLFPDGENPVLQTTPSSHFHYWKFWFLFPKMPTPFISFFLFFQFGFYYCLDFLSATFTWSIICFFIFHYFSLCGGLFFAHCFIILTHIPLIMFSFL